MLVNLFFCVYIIENINTSYILTIIKINSLLIASLAIQVENVRPYETLLANYLIPKYFYNFLICRYCDRAKNISRLVFRYLR